MSHRIEIVLTAILFLLMLGLHSLNLTADIPDNFASQDVGLRVDEGYKTLGPRNMTLFGNIRWSPYDEYSYWFIGSPLTQVVILGTFKIFGAALRVARMTALGYFALLVFLLVWLKRREMDSKLIILTLFLVGIEPYLFFYSRVALFEVLISLFLTFSILLFDCYHHLSDKIKIIVYIGCMVAAIFLVKSSALIYFTPALIGLTLSLVFRPRQIDIKTFLIVSIVFILITVLAYLSYPIWRHRISLIDPSTIFIRLAGNPLGTLTPYFTAAAFFAGADIIRHKGLSLLNDKYIVALLFTIVGAPLLLALLTYGPPRYYVPVIPAQVLLIVYWVNLFYRKRKKASSNIWLNYIVAWPISTTAIFYFIWATINILLPYTTINQGNEPGISTPTAVRLLLPPAALAAFMWLFIEMYGVKIQRFKSTIAVFVLVLATIHSVGVISPIIIAPNYEGQKITNKLQLILPKEASIIGDWSPFFALGTNFPALYANDGWNQGKQILLMRPTHYIDSGTRFDKNNIASYKKLGVKFNKLQLLGIYFGHTVFLYEIDYSDIKNTPKQAGNSQSEQVR